jgi:hypothetical protein
MFDVHRRGDPAHGLALFRIAARVQENATRKPRMKRI